MTLTDQRREPNRQYFELFNEIGIIAQLSRTIMELRLPAGLALPHFSVVNHLARLGDGVTPGNLSDAFQVPKNSMTNTLTGLEKRGLVEMRPNPDDARSRCVFLTRAGRDYRDRAIEVLATDFSELAERLPIGEVDRLLPGLKLVRRALDENRPSRRKSPAGSADTE